MACSPAELRRCSATRQAAVEIPAARARPVSVAPFLWMAALMAQRSQFGIHRSVQLPEAEVTFVTYGTFLLLPQA